jgi:hypothetical protein
VLDETRAPDANVWVTAEAMDTQPELGALLQTIKRVEESRRSLSNEEGAFELAGLAEQANPIEHLIVELSNERTAQRRHEVSHDPAGRFELDSVTPGPVRLVAHDRHRNLSITTHDLHPNQRLEGIRLQLQRSSADAAQR